MLVFAAADAGGDANQADCSALVAVGKAAIAPTTATVRMNVDHVTDFRWLPVLMLLEI
jgi:hypothetical protein